MKCRLQNGSHLVLSSVFYPVANYLSWIWPLVNQIVGLLIRSASWACIVPHSTIICKFVYPILILCQSDCRILNKENTKTCIVLYYKMISENIARSGQFREGIAQLLINKCSFIYEDQSWLVCITNHDHTTTGQTHVSLIKTYRFEIGVTF